MKVNLKQFTPIKNDNIYKKPIKISRALIAMQREECRGALNPKDEIYSKFVKCISKNKELSGMRVSKFIGRGASAIVFETPDGKVLKLTNGNHFPLNRPQQEFDVPIHKKGKAGSVHYYLEEKMYSHGLGEGFVDIMRDMIRKAGFKPYDMYDSDYFQLGMSREGKLYLLDPECARYKTIFHAIWDKVKRFCKK